MRTEIKVKNVRLCRFLGGVSFVEMFCYLCLSLPYCHVYSFPVGKG